MSYVQSYIQIYSNCFSCFRLSCPSNFQFSGRNRHSLPSWGCLWRIRSGAQGACHGAVCCAVCFHGQGMKNAGKTLEKPWKRVKRIELCDFLKLPCVSLFSRANTSEVQHLIIFVIGEIVPGFSICEKEQNPKQSYPLVN